MLTKTGIKLLDFGLAKLAEQGAIGGGLAELATKSVPLTATGSIVGTLNYMSPEQLEGGPIDARTDIFCVRRGPLRDAQRPAAFDAQSHAGLIAAILNDDPPQLDEARHGPATAAAVPASAPSIACCESASAKDPEERWQSAADLGAELRWIQHELLVSTGRGDEASGAVAVPVRSRRHGARLDGDCRRRRARTGGRRRVVL